MNPDAVVFSPHAIVQIERRGLRAEHVLLTLRDPESVDTVRAGRVVAQRPFAMGQPPKEYLVRVFVDIDREPAVVVTAYRTSKIRKHRANP